MARLKYKGLPLPSNLEALNIKTAKLENEIANLENEIANLENKDKKIREDSEMPLFTRNSSVPTQLLPLLPPSMLPSETPVKTPSTEPALHASSSSLKPPESGSLMASWNAQTGPKKDWEQRFTDLASTPEIPKETIASPIADIKSNFLSDFTCSFGDELFWYPRRPAYTCCHFAKLAQQATR